jgi:hypothetical protein
MGIRRDSHLLLGQSCQLMGLPKASSQQYHPEKATLFSMPLPHPRFGNGPVDCNTGNPRTDLALRCLLEPTQ